MAQRKEHILPSFMVAQIQTQRDLEWSRALGITDRVLNPQQAAEWLEKDRQERAHNVSDARVRRGPQWS